MNAFALDENLYSVEFYWDKAGEYAENGYKAYSVEYGAQLKKPIDPERENEVFVGWKDWNTDEVVDVSAQYMDNINGRRFYAAWVNRYYTSTFYVDGNILAEITQEYAQSFILPRTPGKDGYSFKQWSPTPPRTTPANDTQFYAVFEPNKYIASFLVDGEIYKQTEYTYGQKSVTLPKIPEKDGYDAYWESYSLVIGGVEINAIYVPKGKVDCVSFESVKVNYKSKGTLKAVVKTQGEVNYSIYYFSSNPNIVTVDPDGNYYAKSRGTTSVVCMVTDQYGNRVSSVADVTVKYAWWQWLIKIVLFGWIWY